MSATSTRRAVLAGAAAIPALSLPVIAAAEPDPIFEAIERFKNAYAFHGECLKSAETLADYNQAEKLQEDGSHAEWSAREALFKTVPTTSAGALAMISTLLADEMLPDLGFGELALESLAMFLRTD